MGILLYILTQIYLYCQISSNKLLLSAYYVEDSCCMLWKAKGMLRSWNSLFIFYISLLLLLLLCLPILEATFPSVCVSVHTCVSVCTCTYTSLLIFYSVWLLGKSACVAFLGWWPYKSFESQLVFWTFEMLTARKPSHFWKKVCHKNWTSLKKEPDANGKYKCYPKMF